MMFVDRLKPAMRELVYEFGLEIVRGMMGDGWTDPDKLKPELEVWRERQQV